MKLYSTLGCVFGTLYIAAFSYITGTAGMEGISERGMKKVTEREQPLYDSLIYNQSLSRKNEMAVEAGDLSTKYGNGEDGVRMWQSDVESFLNEDFISTVRSRTDEEKLYVAVKRVHLWRLATSCSYVMRNLRKFKTSEELQEILNRVAQRLLSYNNADLSDMAERILHSPITDACLN